MEVTLYFGGKKGRSNTLSLLSFRKKLISSKSVHQARRARVQVRLTPRPPRARRARVQETWASATPSKESKGTSVTRASAKASWVSSPGFLLCMFMTLKSYLQWMLLLQYNPGFTRGPLWSWNNSHQSNNNHVHIQCKLYRWRSDFPLRVPIIY